VPKSSVSGQVFNVGSNSLNYRKIQVIEMIRKYFPQTNVQLRDDVTDPRSYKVSFDKINKLLGFQATRNLEDGIKEMKQSLENTERKNRLKENSS